MPFYDFQCPNNHRFELKQSFDSEPMAICPTCKTMAKRLISLVPVHFKGSGFYVNDYARKEPAVSEGSKDAGSDKTSTKPVEGAKSEPAKAASSESGKGTKDAKAGESKAKSEPAKSESSKSKSSEGAAATKA